MRRRPRWINSGHNLEQTPLRRRQLVQRGADQRLLTCCDQVFPNMQTGGGATTMQNTPIPLHAGNGRARHWHRRWPSSSEGMGCTPSRCAICKTRLSE